MTHSNKAIDLILERDAEKVGDFMCIANTCIPNAVIAIKMCSKDKVVCGSGHSLDIGVFTMIPTTVSTD